MAEKHFQRSYHSNKYKIEVGLTVLIWEEDGVVFYYSPALDLTGYGRSEQEAGKSFEIVLESFVDYTSKKDTIFDELEELGWTVNRKKKRISAPSTEELLSENETFRELQNKIGVREEQRKVELSLV